VLHTGSAESPIVDPFNKGTESGFSSSLAQVISASCSHKRNASDDDDPLMKWTEEAPVNQFIWAFAYANPL
jgi:hypothetical protein